MQQQCRATVANLPHPTISFSQAGLNRNPLKHHEWWMDDKWPGDNFCYVPVH
jgi:hypothetical protein